MEGENITVCILFRTEWNKKGGFVIPEKRPVRPPPMAGIPSINAKIRTKNQFRK